MAPGVPAPKPEKAGIFEDFVDIFYSPAAVYERRRSASAWIPMMVATLAIGLSYVVSRGAMQPIMDAEAARFRAALPVDPNAPAVPESAQAIADVFGMVGAFVGVPITIALIGLTLWLAGKLFDATQSAGVSIMIAAYAFLPRALQAVLNPLQLRFMSTESLDGMYRLSAGPARVLDPDTTSAVLLAVAGRFDLFILWSTLLLAIGLSVVARIPRAQAYVAAVLVWLAGALPAVLPALAFAGGS